MRLKTPYKIVEMGEKAFALFSAGESGQESYRPYAVNDTGRRMLELLQHPRSLEELIGLLSEEYSVEAAILEQDVRDYLQHLRDYDILEE